MSRLSIYETRWIDLVFENRNKEYGAYQLRRESVKSSLTALFMGLLLIASFAGIASIVNYFNPEIKPEITIPDFSDTIIHVTDIVLQEIEKPVLPEVKSQATEAVIMKDQLVNPVVVHSNDAVQDIATNEENKNTSNVISDGTGTIGTSISSSGGGTGTEITKAVDHGTSIVNTTILDKMPEFPGGIDQFYKYVGNNFEKPEIDAMNTIKIYVYFVIEKDGSMTDIKVNRDPGYGLGREAVRVLKSLKTKWTPGMINSKPVRTAYNLPIVVQIN
jgi:protein TonB